MERARDAESDDIVEAESLWYMAFVDQQRYRCVDCGTKVFPASFDRLVNKKRPYFTLGKNGAHIEPCNIDGEGEAKLIRRAATERIGTPEGFPLPYPNRLVIEDYRLVAAKPDEQTGQPYPQRPSSRASPSVSPSNKHHGHTVKTIRPIARAYMRYPKDREHLKLTVPNCSGSTFASVFWRLTKTMRLRKLTQLFFAPLRWTAPQKTDEWAEWVLDAGDWDIALNKRTSNYRLRVQYDDWSPRCRETFFHEIEVALDAAKNAGTGKLKAWVFFCRNTRR